MTKGDLNKTEHAITVVVHQTAEGAVEGMTGMEQDKFNKAMVSNAVVAAFMAKDFIDKLEHSDGVLDSFAEIAAEIVEDPLIDGDLQIVIELMHHGGALQALSIGAQPVQIVQVIKNKIAEPATPGCSCPLCDLKRDRDSKPNPN